MPIPHGKINEVFTKSLQNNLKSCYKAFMYHKASLPAAVAVEEIRTMPTVTELKVTRKDREKK